MFSVGCSLPYPAENNAALATQSRIRTENDYLLTLWHQAQAGDKAAFCRLAEQQYRALFTYATQFTDDRAFIKDSIQNVLIRIWEKRTTISPQFVAVYLFKSLRNELVGTLRRNHASFASLPGEAADGWSDGQTIETEIEQHEADAANHRRIQRAIEGLPKRQQEVVFLKFYQGLENEQIARLMDINRQSVANLLCRALDVLKSRMALFTYRLIALVLLTE